MIVHLSAILEERPAHSFDILGGVSRNKIHHNTCASASLALVRPTVAFVLSDTKKFLLGLCATGLLAYQYTNGNSHFFKQTEVKRTHSKLVVYEYEMFEVNALLHNFYW